MLEIDKPVVDAACPLKHLPLHFAMNFRFDSDPQEKKVIVDNSAIEVVDIGFSFLLIRRHLFEN